MEKKFNQNKSKNFIKDLFFDLYDQVNFLRLENNIIKHDY